MRVVGINALTNPTGEYLRAVATGRRTVLVTDRNRVVAELVPPAPGRSVSPADALWPMPCPEGIGHAAAACRFWRAAQSAGREVQRTHACFNWVKIGKGVDLPRYFCRAGAYPRGRSRATGSPVEQPLIASHLLEYEMWTRLQARDLAVRTIRMRAPYRTRHGDRTRPAGPRAGPRTFSVRSAPSMRCILHPSEFLRLHGQTIELASYDDRLLLASKALGIPIVAL